jgi:hypothetical protein
VDPRVGIADMCGWPGPDPRGRRGEREPSGDVPARRPPGSMDRGEEAAGGAVEGEAAVLPGRALAESRQPLHVAPDRTRIRLVPFCQIVRLDGCAVECPDVSCSTGASEATASVLNARVSMVRASMRLRRAQAAS